jgi:4-amino-4-deoxy-L-arabinose transferase-like glycosyltransferase
VSGERGSFARLTPLAIGLAFVALYWRTLAPDLVGHDAGELQFVPYVFGIPHYTGYPLYLLLGKGWTFVPFGSVAWRMNLLSAMFGALAAALAYLCGRELTGSRAAGLVAALAVGLAPLEWTWSTIAGVRSLAVAFVAATLLAAMRWQRAVHAGEAKLAERRLLLLALLAGFGMDHHRTFALLLPFLAAYVLLVRWRTVLDVRLLARAAGLFLLPLLLYGVLPLRAAFGAPFDQWNTATWQGFMNVAVAGTESSAHLDLTPAQALSRVPDVGAALLGTFSPLVLTLAVVGLVWLAIRRPALALLLSAYTAVLAWLTVVWNIGGQLNLVYLMPAYAPLALMAAAGLALMLRPLQSLAERAGAPSRAAAGGGRGEATGSGLTSRGAAPGAGALAASGFPAAFLAPAGGALATILVAAGGLYLGRAHFQAPPEVLDDFRQELFQGHQARRLANALAALPPNATVVADWDQATPLWYGELVDGINPGVGISYPAGTLPGVLARAHGPVFLATAAFPPATATVSALGPFVEVLAQPRTRLPEGVMPIGGVFGGDVQLAGMAPLRQPEYGVLPLTLYWKALRQPSADYHVSVRLMPSPDRVSAQRDEAAPVLGLSPTSRWTAGQVTGDYYELDLRGLSDGAYDLAVVLYEALPGGGFRNLSYGASERAVVGKLTLAGGHTTFAPAAV